ncbi:MAG: sel1 repeat family protein, partial [Ruminococcus sp.]|nr:sel1 repeat family protein [Ruminococcus sp.]
SVRNMIIRNVLKMDSLIMLGQPDNLDMSELTEDIYYQPEWSEDYRKAHELLKKTNLIEQEKKNCFGLLINEAKNGNILALLDLGKIYRSDFLGEPNAEKSYQYYGKALHEMILLEPKAKKIKAGLQYQIGKMFCCGIGAEQNPEKAEKYLSLSAQAGNSDAKRMLGKELLSGENILKDTQRGLKLLSECAEDSDLYAAYLLARFLLKNTEYRNPVRAMALLNQAAEGGNGYAQRLLETMQEHQNQMFAETSFRLFVGLSRIIDENYHQEQKQLLSYVESKLKEMIERKKKELGIKSEHSQKI